MKAFSMLSNGFVRRAKRSYLLLVCLAACYPSGLRLKAQILTREDLQRETAAYEEPSLSSEPPQMSAIEAGRVWLRLGVPYQDAGRFGQSEMAYEHAMRLFTVVPISGPDLADAGWSRSCRRAGITSLRFIFENMRQRDRDRLQRGHSAHFRRECEEA
jgi:hypothetical protein